MRLLYLGLGVVFFSATPMCILVAQENKLAYQVIDLSSEGFSFTLPSGWKELPKDKLEKKIERVKKINPNVKISNFNHFFSTQPIDTWYYNPNILEVSELLEDYTEKNVVIEIYGNLNNSGEIIAFSHDSLNHRVNFIVRNNTTIVTGSYYFTTKRVIAITCFCYESEIDSYKGIFANVLNSVVIKTDEKIHNASAISNVVKIGMLLLGILIFAIWVFLGWKKRLGPNGWKWVVAVPPGYIVHWTLIGDITKDVINLPFFMLFTYLFAMLFKVKAFTEKVESPGLDNKIKKKKWKLTVGLGPNGAKWLWATIVGYVSYNALNYVVKNKGLGDPLKFADGVGYGFVALLLLIIAIGIIAIIFGVRKYNPSSPPKTEA